MIYKIKGKYATYGEAIAILSPEGTVPLIPGDVGNATTYSFPVRLKRVKGLTVQDLFNHNERKLNTLLDAVRETVDEGVRAITGGCGFMALFQQEVASAVDVPVFLSSLLQIPFISKIISPKKKVGILTANSESLDATLLKKVGVDDSIPVYIKGMENKENWYKSIIAVEGTLDTEKMEEELVSAAKEMVESDPDIKAILLECTDMPPYGAAVQEAVNLPVFDLVTMINYVYLAVVKQRFTGFM